MIDSLDTYLKGKDFRAEAEQRSLNQLKSEQLREQEREMRHVRDMELQREHLRSILDDLQRDRQAARLARQQNNGDTVVNRLRMRDNHAAMNAFEKGYKCPLKRCSRKELAEFYSTDFPITTLPFQRWDLFTSSSSSSSSADKLL